jgi:hypothetical protein
MLAAAGTEQATNYITLHDSNTMLSDGGWQAAPVCDQTYTVAGQVL